MKLSLAFSPCPNDTFIFDALVNNKIDTEGIKFDVLLEDVQTLNTWAIEGKADISKISYGVLPLVVKNYNVLNSGGALGLGVGPLLITKNPVQDLSQEINRMHIAIPGVNTTAHLLFSYAFPLAKHKKFVVFNQVEDAVLSGSVDAGVIIHENRFTYQDRGLFKLVDLGEHWEKKTGVPIPLGGIVIRKTLQTQLQQTIDRLIKKSVEYAFSNYPGLPYYVTTNAQEMNEEVIRKHIDLYVNDFSISLGTEGKDAITKLMEVYQQINGTGVKQFEDFIVEG